MSGRVQTGEVATAFSRVVFEAGDVKLPIRVTVEEYCRGDPPAAAEWTLQEAMQARDTLQESIDAVMDAGRRAIPAPPPVRRRGRHAAGGG